MSEVWSWSDVEGLSSDVVASKTTYTKVTRTRPAIADAIERYALEGKSAKEAGDLLEMSRSAVLGCAWRNGIKFHGHYVRPNPGLMGKIQSWVSKHPFGTRLECAKALGVSPQTVNAYAKKIRENWAS